MVTLNSRRPVFTFSLERGASSWFGDCRKHTKREQKMATKTNAILKDAEERRLVKNNDLLLNRRVNRGSQQCLCTTCSSDSELQSMAERARQSEPGSDRQPATGSEREPGNESSPSAARRLESIAPLRRAGRLYRSPHNAKCVFHKAFSCSLFH